MLAGLTKGDPPIPVYSVDACGELINGWLATFRAVEHLVRATVTKARMNGGGRTWWVGGGGCCLGWSSKGGGGRARSCGKRQRGRRSTTQFRGVLPR